MPPPRPAIFLDRDDTLIACNDLPPPPPPAAPGDLTNPALVSLLPGVFDGCHRLIAAGYQLVVFSNQGLIARGGGPLTTPEAVNDALRAALHLPTLPIYFCPFHPKGTIPAFTREHPWRKPAPGMILAAQTELNVQARWVLGDAPRDVESGINAGIPPARCLLIGPRGISFSAACDLICQSPLN